VENYLTKSVEKSNTDPYAAYILGMLYLEGVILRRDCRKAKHYLLLAAKLGSVEALNAIGDCFYSGDVFPKSTNCALYYYEKAAKSGYGPAQFNAGIVLLNSRKSKTYLLKAVNYLDKASRNSNDLGDVAKHAVKYKKDAQRKIQSIKLPKN
jgi:TPR repeat protein